MKTWLKSTLAGLIVAALAAGIGGATYYNQFSPGGALGGTWNSQTVNMAAGASFILNQLPPASGGLGTNCAATNGFVPIGNGSNLACVGLSAGAGITITPAAGGNTIASTGTGWTYKVVTGSDTRTSTASNTNDTFLVYTSLASGHYLVFCNLGFSSTTATGTFPGARWAWTTTTNGTYISRSYVVPTLSGIVNFASGFPGSFLGSASFTQSAGGASAAFMNSQEYLLFSSTGSGTLNLGWGQSTSSANTTTMVQGSYCKLLKVS